MDQGDRIQMNRRNLSIRWLYVPPTPLSEQGGLLGLEQGCHHLPATSTNRGIELHSNVVINPGTTPTLTSTTLALRKDTLVYPGPQFQSAQLRKMKQSHVTRTSLAYESNKANMAHKQDHTHNHEHMNQSTEQINKLEYKLKTLHKEKVKDIPDSQ